MDDNELNNLFSFSFSFQPLKDYLKKIQTNLCDQYQEIIELRKKLEGDMSYKKE